MKLTSTIAFLALALASGLAHAADESGVSRTFPEPQPAMNREEMKPSLAINAGIANTAERDYDGALGYGIEFGYQHWIPVGVAFELSGYSSDGDGDTASLTRTKLLGKANYHFGGTIPVIKESYVGLGLGPVLDNVAGDNEVQLGFAPQVGFDIPLTDTKYSLGANANYLFVTGNNPDVFALNGVAKYWF